MSKNNVKMVQRKMADQKQKFGIRKLSVGVASVLLGTVFYMQGGTVHADVNPTMSAGNDTANVINENSGISSSAVTLSTSNSASSANSASSVVSASDVANSIAPSQMSVSSVDSITSQVSNSVSAVSEQGSVVSTSQVNVGVDNVIDSDNTSVASSLASVHNSQVSASTENVSNGQAHSNSLLSLNQSSNVNTSFLVLSKVVSTGASNDAANGGFDQSKWGTLDVSKWTGRENNGVYELTGYTGDLEHIIVPNSADVREKILTDIKVKLADYQKSHADVDIKPAKPLDQLTELVDLANAKFTVKHTLPELDTNDEFALDPVNGLHEHKNVNDNGGYDTDFWGTLDVSKFTTVKNGDNLEITGYTGDASKVIIPNIADFWANGLDQGAKQVTISSYVMHQLAKNATRIGLSKTNNQKVVASDADWSYTFGGMTYNPQTGFNADGGMWVYNPNLTVMDLHNLDTINITGMSSMFNGGRNLKVIGDLSQWNTANVTSMHAMFQTASSLTNIGDLDNWNTSKVTDMASMFGVTTNLTNIGDLSKWNTGNVTDMDNMFANATNLTNIGNLDNWDTNKVTDMSWMFGTDTGKQSHLTNIGDLSKWDTGNVTDMSCMFFNATNLTNIGNLDNWSTSKVTNMLGMFGIDSGKPMHLTNIGNLSKWQTGNVTNMSYMFSNATNLTNIGNLDNWNTSKVTDMSYMFYNATHLINIGNLSKWQTGNVTNVSNMFYNTEALRHLNISNWDLTKLANKNSMQYMFAEDPSLTVIANDLTLPTWYQNEINDSDYFWNNHMAVITNVPELIRATGDIDNLKIDNQDASRSIFYDSKGSSDALQVLKDANQAYAKQYQNEHPGYILNLAADVDQTDPIALANAKFTSSKIPQTFKVNFVDDANGQIVASSSVEQALVDTTLTLDAKALTKLIPEHYYFTDANYSIPTSFNYQHVTDNLIIHLTKAPVYMFNLVDDTSSKTNSTLVWDGIDSNHHLTGTVSDLNQKIRQAVNAVEWKNVPAGAQHGNAPKSANLLTTVTDLTALPTQDTIQTVHFVHATHSINEAHDVSQVIHYVYQNGSKALDDHVDSVHFARDGYHDEFDNTDHWNSWTPSATYDFVAVHSPRIQGFTPDIQTVDQTTVTPSSQNVEQTVTYYGDVQLGHVKYIDDSDNGRVMSSDDLSGHTGETDSYTTTKNIKNYISQGYVFVSDNYPATGVVFDNNDLVDQYFEVHFKHGTITVTPDQPGKPGEPINPGDPDGSKYPNGTDAKSLQVDVPRTIDYVYQNGKQAQASVNDSLHFTETKVIDKVTGNVLSDVWSPAQSFETKITPTIEGYTPDRQSVSNTGINHDHPAIHEVVTYNPDAQKAVVKYIDDTDQKQLSAEDLTGYSDEDSGYNTKSSIDKYLAGHYVLVSDDTHGQNVIYDHDDKTNQVYEVHFKHGTEPASESRVKNLIVHYVYADGVARSGQASADQKAQSLTFKRTGTKDLVTNSIAWNAWDHAGQTFDEIKSPTIDGYTPDQTSIKDVQVNADGLALTEKTVTYNADSQKLTVNFIDDVTGKTLETVNKVGQSDESANYDTKSDISKYIAQHYDLVSDDTKGSNLVFDHDDNVDQVYNVHLTHHTHQINDQVTKSEVIHYVYADGLARTGQAADDYHAKDLVFTRDGYHDEVTNEDHWNAWTPDQQEFVSVQSPKIDGYSADQTEIPVIKMNSASDNIKRTVTYNADKQKLDVVFIDDTLGKTLSTVTKEGLSDESASYNTKDDINHYKSLHYNVVSDGTQGQNLVFDHNDSKDQHYEVHLVHATHPIDEQKLIKQTIHYQLADGTKVFDDHAAQVDFSRDGYHDEVTNEDHWNKWTPSDIQTFSNVVSPVKPGYTPDKASVAAVDVHPGDKDVEETVIYSPDKQVMTIHYIDDVTGRTLSTKQITGVSDASANYNTKSSINSYVADHYKLVSDDTNGDNLVFDHDDSTDQVYNVHLTHTYQKVDDHKSVNETVHYVYNNGQIARSDYKAPAINFSRTGTKDLVTSNIVWNAWTPAEQSFASVTTPAISGYTPDVEVVPSVNVNYGSADVERTVVYHTDDQTILVNYIDDDTQSTLKTDTVIGKTAQKSNYTTKKSIDGYIADHYKLVSDDTKGQELVFDSDSTKAQVYNVHLKHAHQNVSDSALVNETIHYIYADGSKASDDYHASAISFKRTGDKDLVTNAIVWYAWIPASQDFKVVDSPVIDGYTPSQKTISNITVKPGDKDIYQTVVYAPDTQSIVVNYIDDVTGKTLKTDMLTGKSDRTSDYTTKNNINGYENQHYVLVSDDTQGKTLTFDHDDSATQVYNVHLSHQTEPASQSRTVHETINYVYADGSKAADTVTAKPLTFTQTGVKDLVTGNIDWNGTWTAKQTFAEVKSPEIIGYTASRTFVDPITVDHNSSDIHQTIVYTANDQTARINYIDDVTGKTLETDSANGKFGDQIKFGHDVDTQIKAFESQGYKFKSNSFTGQKYQADNSQNEFEVHFTHGTQNVSRTNKVTETVKYQFGDGRQAQKDHVQTVEFTQHGVQDLVTKTTVWTSSDPQTFVSVDTPNITGYTADIQNVPAATVNFGDANITKVVTYKANDQLAGIKYIDDTIGETLDTEAASGKFGTKIEFMSDPSSMIEKFEGQGYKFKSNSFNGQKYQADNSKNQFEVHFTHGTQNVSRTDKVTETVKYQFSDGRQAQKDHVQTAEFTQHGVQDLVTKTTVWTSSDSQTFVSVDTPHITGYTADVQNVPAVTVNFCDANITKVVTYKANDQLAGIKYIDDTTDKTLDTEAASGKFGTKIEFMSDPAAMIQKFEGQGYKLVSNSFKDQDYQADNSKNQFEVHFKHGVKNVSRTSTITRTIKYVDQTTGEEVHQPVIQTLTFTENGVTDLVTGKTTWDTPSDQQFVKVESPKIDGYENPDILVVDAETAKFGDGDQTVTVHYQKVETPATSDTSKAPSNSSIPSAPTIQAKSNISTMPMHTPTQVGSQNVSGQQISNNRGESQLPQTGNQSETGLIALGLLTLAGMFGLVAKRRSN